MGMGMEMTATEVTRLMAKFVSAVAPTAVMAIKTMSMRTTTTTKTTTTTAPPLLPAWLRRVPFPLRNLDRSRRRGMERQAQEGKHKPDQSRIWTRM